MRKICFLILLLLPKIITAQWIHNDLISNTSIDTVFNNKFSFDASVTGFFKNNEYSLPYAKGETFPGVKFLPRFGYQLENKFRFEIGSSGLYYSGDQKSFGKRLFNALHFKMQYAISEDFNFIIGNYYGGLNHRLIEPLYRWEKHFTDKPESGLQLLYDRNKLFADVWLNWQRFIERNDPLQEVLTFGVSSSYMLTNPNSRFSVSIPFQLVINHKGGQIDSSSKRNLVIGNLVSGIKTSFALEHGFFSSVDFDLYLAGYYDKIYIPEERPYDTGWGAYPVLTLNANRFKFMVGYWHAQQFYSVEGEPLFASFNHLYPGEKQHTKSLLTNKFSYTQKLMKFLSLGVQAEIYTDFNSGNVDYSFGVHMKFDLPPVSWKW